MNFEKSVDNMILGLINTFIIISLFMTASMWLSGFYSVTPFLRLLSDSGEYIKITDIITNNPGLALHEFTALFLLLSTTKIAFTFFKIRKENIFTSALSTFILSMVLIIFCLIIVYNVLMPTLADARLVNDILYVIGMISPIFIPLLSIVSALGKHFDSENELTAFAVSKTITESKIYKIAQATFYHTIFLLVVILFIELRYGTLNNAFTILWNMGMGYVPLVLSVIALVALIKWVINLKKASL